MPRPCRALLIGLLLAALAWPALHAAQAGAAGAQYAFLVGCSKYLKTEFRELPFTGNDVTGLRDALLQTGFAPENVFALYDRTDDPQRYLPTRANVLQELDLLLDGMRPDDTLVVALSGHGVQFKGDPVSYFVPLDGKVEDKKTLIALDGPGGLYDKLKACKAKKKLLVVNACRNDPTVSLDFASKKLELADEDRDEVPAGIAAIYSCRAGQKSYYDPQRKRALFFEHFIRAWQGEYAGGQPVTLEHVFAQVTARTKADAHRTLRASQVPQVRRDDLAGEWAVSPAALAAGQALLRQGTPAKALVHLEKAVAAAPGSAAARVARGIAYLRTGRCGEALADFKEAARLEPDSAEAALQLGWVSYYGYGIVPPDRAEAARQFRAAAERGDAEAMAKLGEHYAFGLGLARDDTEAVRWFKKAAELGEPMGMYLLGEAYRRGVGVASDKAQADRWYRSAAQAIKDTSASRPQDIQTLGLLYAHGRSVARNDAEAVRWFKKAAELGYPAAMNNLGFMYEQGQGVSKDDAEAVRWYKKAAELGQPAAMSGLGLMYAKGRGLSKDNAEALRWIKKAVELGDPFAMNILATMYAEGFGVPKDDTEAVRWFKKAAELGHANAMMGLGVMYASGRGVAMDDAEAVRWYKKAAELGHPIAMTSLGWIYENGRTVTRDLDEAIRWYRRAAEKGNNVARDALKRLKAE